MKTLQKKPGVAAQYQSGVACSNGFPCGIGGLKCTNCVEVCTHKMGVILADYHVAHLFYQILGHHHPKAYLS